jgi:hydroxypyruvate isomerase
MLERRKFLRNGLLGTAAGFVPLSVPSFANTKPANTNARAGDTFKLMYAFHDGMFKNSGGNDFVDQIKYGYDQGFRSIEDNGMMGRTPEQQKKIGDALAKLGMTMGVFVVDKGGNSANSLASGKQEYLDIFLKGCRNTVEVAKRVNAKWVTVVPGDYVRNIPLGLQTANVVDALRKGAEILEPHNIIMVLEPLSDSPDLFLQNSDQTYSICKSVNSPSCKLLFDMFHMQRNEGNLINNIDRTYSEIAYLQIGDNPGRNEPTTGEVNYKNVFKHLHEKGYKGVLGMEHGNSIKGKDGEAAVIKAYRDSDNF